MTRRPLVTVGVPVFNGEPYLRQALDSVRDQHHDHLEIVISDNASTDATPEICRAAAAADPRVRYVPQDRNRGGAWNFNETISLARGEYFTFAAADDVMRPDFVSGCVAALESRGPGCVLAFPRTQLIDERGDLIGDLADEHLHVDQATPHERIAVLLRAEASHIVYGVIRTDVLRATRRIRPVVGDDIVLLVELACRGTFALVPDRSFLQRRHDQQYSARGAGQVQWYSPGSSARLAFPQTKLNLECLRAVTSSPLPARERARSLGAVTRHWVLPRWRGMVGDIRLAVGR